MIKLYKSKFEHNNKKFTQVGFIIKNGTKVALLGTDLNFYKKPKIRNIEANVVFKKCKEFYWLFFQVIKIDFEQGIDIDRVIKDIFKIDQI